jgi:hypothetical protein
LITNRRPIRPAAAGHGRTAKVSCGRFLPDLIDLVWTRRVDPGKVFGMTS